MIEVAFSSSFKRAFKKRIKNQPLKEKSFYQKLEIFIQDLYNPQLKTHKLSGKLKDLWSFAIGYDLRVVFCFSNKDQAIFEDIGTHEEIY